jgi:hypothetical protein
LGYVRAPTLLSLPLHRSTASRTSPEAFCCDRISISLEVEMSSHRLSLPFRVSPIYTACSVSPPLGPEDPRVCVLTNMPPSEVLFPSAFIGPLEPLTPHTFPRVRYVASLGFCTLSTPCSPIDLPSLFHPGSALGIRPSRLLSLLSAVDSLEPRGLPDV